MFGKAQVQNSNDCKRGKFRIPIFEKGRYLKFQLLEKQKFRIRIFRKQRNLVFQCLEKGEIQNTNHLEKGEI